MSSHIPHHPYGALERGSCARQIVRAGEAREVDADFVIPVYNEQAELGSSIMILKEKLGNITANDRGFSWQIVIADNASTDETWNVASALVDAFPEAVRALKIPEKGRGRALKIAWSESQALARAYMDVDLSTDLDLVGELVDPILDGTADLCFGSRLMEGAQITRSAKRETISRTYNRMLQTYLDVGFRDAQCGFKAISAMAAEALLPYVEDNEWFFDTELLVLAERLGIATHEFPVRWVEDPGSTVNIIDTARKDLRGMKRIKGTRPASGARRRNTIGPSITPRKETIR